MLRNRPSEKAQEGASCVDAAELALVARRCTGDVPEKCLQQWGRVGGGMENADHLPGHPAAAVVGQEQGLVPAGPSGQTLLPPDKSEWGREDERVPLGPSLL